LGRCGEGKKIAPFPAAGSYGGLITGYFFEFQVRHSFLLYSSPAILPEIKSKHYIPQKDAEGKRKSFALYRFLSRMLMSDCSTCSIFLQRSDSRSNPPFSMNPAISPCHDRPQGKISDFKGLSAALTHLNPLIRPAFWHRP
jgi:hypothetical protein